MGVPGATFPGALYMSSAQHSHSQLFSRWFYKDCGKAHIDL